jgi:hypothetical protein
MEEIMQIDPKLLPEFLEKFSFADYGDRYEKELSHYLTDNFPNCERFWKIFVIPFTKRMDGYPEKHLETLDVRQDMDTRLMDIANAHYSMFLNLVFAHVHLEKRILSSVENIYAHLGSVCDLAEMVIEKWYLLLLECQGQESKVFQGLSRDEFLEKAGKLYDEGYPAWYEHYLKIGKKPHIELISGSDLLTEYFGKNVNSRKAYAAHSQSIRTMRNVIVHDVKIARIEKTGKLLIPKSKTISKYRKWYQVEAVLDDVAKVNADFQEQYQQAKDDLDTLEKNLNALWDKLLEDFVAEFYAKERAILRKMYKIELTSDAPLILDKKHTLDSAPMYPSVSGTYPYTGGTIEYRMPNEDDEKFLPFQSD